MGNFKGMHLLKGRLCGDCNAFLGRELDEELARTGPTGLYRSTYGIAGRRSHATVSPFHYRALSPLQPTTLKRPAPHGEWEILGDSYTSDDGRPCSRTLRQVVVKSTTGAIEPLPFPRAWTAAQVTGMLHERGLQGAQLIEVYLDEDEAIDDDDVRRLLTDVFGVFHQIRVWGGDQIDSKLEPVTVAAAITRKYLRALAKVGFHYFLSVADCCSGAEDEFAEVRAFIRNDDGDAKTFVELSSPYFIPAIAEGYVPQRTSHFFFYDQNPDGVTAKLQFFVGPRSLYPPAAVRLGPNPRPESPRGLTCHQVTYYDERIDGLDGEITPVALVVHPS
jgi:hypothetical protein